MTDRSGALLFLLCAMLAQTWGCARRVASHPSSVAPSASRPSSRAPTASAAASAGSPPTVFALDIDHDRTLRALRSALPAGWRMFAQGNRLVVERIEPVWVLWENQISRAASSETQADRATRIEQHGQRANSRIVIRVEARWPDDRLREQRASNVAVYDRLAKLAKEHGVEELVDRAKRRKNSDPRIGATAQELPRIEAYEEERKTQQAQLGALPSFLTEHYALFPAEHEAWADAMHVVHPLSAVEDCYRVDDAVRALLTREGTEVTP